VTISVLVLVVAVYAAVATAYLEARRRREAPPSWARTVGPLAVAAHLTGLLALAHAIGRSPFANASQALSFLAFALAALYLVLEATSRVASHGGGFYAVTALLAALSVPGLVESGSLLHAVVRDSARTFHVGLALMGTAAVLAAGLLGVGYLETYRRVKRGRLEDGESGPSLTGFTRLSRVASLLAVLLLGPSLVMGLRAQATVGASATATGLVVTTGVVLVLLAAAAWLWWRRPLRGALASWLCLSGVVVVVVAIALVHPIATSWSR
jgi:hypothetical protein